MISAPPSPPTRLPRYHIRTPTTVAAGNVISQAVTIRPATRQRTWAPGLPTPEPRIEPVATCVVDSANPSALRVGPVPAAISASVMTPIDFCASFVPCASAT
jgi:hypothetical protein